MFIRKISIQTNQPVNIIQFHTVINEDGTHAIYALTFTYTEN